MFDVKIKSKALNTSDFFGFRFFGFSFEYGLIMLKHTVDVNKYKNKVRNSYFIIFS